MIFNQVSKINKVIFKVTNLKKEIAMYVSFSRVVSLTLFSLVMHNCGIKPIESNLSSNLRVSEQALCEFWAGDNTGRSIYRGPAQIASGSDCRTACAAALKNGLKKTCDVVFFQINNNAPITTTITLSYQCDNQEFSFSKTSKPQKFTCK